MDLNWFLRGFFRRSRCPLRTILGALCSKRASHCARTYPNIVLTCVAPRWFVDSRSIVPLRHTIVKHNRGERLASSLHLGDEINDAETSLDDSRHSPHAPRGENASGENRHSNRHAPRSTRKRNMRSKI